MFYPNAWGLFNFVHFYRSHKKECESLNRTSDSLCIEKHCWEETLLRIRIFWITLGVISTWVAVIRSCSLRSQSRALWLAFLTWFPWVRQTLLMWIKLKQTQEGRTVLFSTGRTSAGCAQKCLKAQLKFLSAGPGAHISTGQDCQVQKPKRDHSTLCHLPEGEPSAEHLLLPCVHVKFRTRIQIYINKLFGWFFSSLLSFVMNPAEFQSSALCLQSMNFFSPTDGFSFCYLSITYFFYEWTFEIPPCETICS